MTNSLDPDQTDAGPHCLFLHLNLSVILGNYIYIFAADDFSRRHFLRCIFFLGALRVNAMLESSSRTHGVQRIVILRST